MDLNVASCDRPFGLLCWPHMATPLVTTQILTITNAELQRGNAALSQAETLTAQVTSLTTQNVALQASVAAKDATIAQKNARIAELEALLAQQPPPTTPPPVTPTVPVPGLFVKEGKLYSKKGIEFLIRGVESMYNVDSFNAGADTWCKTQKSLGANTISPLFQGVYGAVSKVKAVCDAARANQLAVGVNADHQGGDFGSWDHLILWIQDGCKVLFNGAVKTATVSGRIVTVDGVAYGESNANRAMFGRDGRLWLMGTSMVSLLNTYDHVFLECEVETGWGQTAQQWVDDVKGLVTDLRNAGHKQPIKVGSPAGGRVPKLAVENGLQVLNHDPLKSVLFTWQSYWHKVAPAGQWHYQQEAGIPVSAADPGGAIEQCKRIADSKLCFVIGIDKVDDVGTTIYREVLIEADKKGLSVQMWCEFGDFRTENNLLGHWDRSPGSITATGIEIKDLFKIKGLPLAL